METLLLRLPGSSLWVVFLGSFILIVVATAVRLIGRIVHPTVIEFPWREKDASLPPSATDSSSSQSRSGTRNSGSSDEERDRKKTVVLAGSFNPIHKGHVSMLEYLATRYVTVVAPQQATTGGAGGKQPRLCSRFIFDHVHPAFNPTLTRFLNLSLDGASLLSYGRVIVAIGINPEKVYRVTPYQRAALIETVLDHELSSYRTKIQVQGVFSMHMSHRQTATRFRSCVCPVLSS